MADERGRRLHQSLKGGDLSVAPAVAAHGARTEDADMLYDGIVQSLSLLGTKELEKIMVAAAAEKAGRDHAIVDSTDIKKLKAAEFKMTQLGVVTLAQFIYEITNFIERCQTQDISKDQYLYTGGNAYDYRQRRYVPRQTTDEILDKAALLQNANNIGISCSSPMRIYRLHTKEENAQMKLDKERREAKKRVREAEEAVQKAREQAAKAQKRAEGLRKKLEKTEKKLKEMK